MTESSAPAEARRGSLYLRMWRWHFYAALLVIPFVLWQSITGTIYLWRTAIADSAYGSLRSVETGTARASLQSQLATVLERHPQQRLTQIEIPQDPNRTVAFYFVSDSGLKLPAFTNPYTGDYLGSIAPLAWLPGISLSLHGGWPLGVYGSYLLELGASWAIVMILTGIYLWWPRHARGFAGILYPRLRAGTRIFWRDLHSIVAVYVAGVAMIFLITALPWTSFWGERVLGALQQATDQVSPTKTFLAPATGAAQSAAASAAHHSDAGAAISADSVDLDAIVATARREGLKGTLDINVGAGHGPVHLRNQLNRSNEEIFLQLDRHTGTLLGRTEWDDVPPIAKAIAYGVDLHEGTYFGLPNQLFNTVVASCLVWLTVSGFMSWYKRRPNGGIAAPPRRAVYFPKAIAVTGVIVCMALPMLGASVIVLGLMDRLVRKALPA